MPSRTVNGKASCPKHSGLNLQVSPPLSPHQLRLIIRDPEQHGSRDGGPTSSNVINNFLDPNDPTSSEARQSRMHFFDNQRKVDYVLVYHYRNRGGQPVQGSSSGHRAPLAVISNGEMGKEPNASRQEDMMIEMGPQDALEEERKEQREEFEYNLMEAGLELEKDLEGHLAQYISPPPSGLSYLESEDPLEKLYRLYNVSQAPKEKFCSEEFTPEESGS